MQYGIMWPHTRQGTITHEGSNFPTNTRLTLELLCEFDSGVSRTVRRLRYTK